jgi:hypothetical protein
MPDLYFLKFKSQGRMMDESPSLGEGEALVNSQAVRTLGLEQG